MSWDPLTVMGKHRLVDRAASLDRASLPPATHVPYALRLPTRPSPAPQNLFDQTLAYPNVDALLLDKSTEVFWPSSGRRAVRNTTTGICLSRELR